jgi:hypothetical protein
LLRRVFDIDLEHCPHCGGPLTIIAANEDPPVIVRILTHLGAGGRLVGGVGFFAQGQRTVYKDLRTRCGTSDELAALIGFVRATPGIAWRATESVSLALAADALVALKKKPCDVRVVSVGVGVYPEPKPPWLRRLAKRYVVSVQLLQKTLEINTQSMEQLRALQRRMARNGKVMTGRDECQKRY